MDPGRREPVALELSDPGWHRFVAESASSSPFHNPAWTELLVRSYGYPGFALAVCDQQGRIVAGAPFVEVRNLTRRSRWISLPFSDECVLLAENLEAKHRLADALAALQERRGGPLLEVRGIVDAVGWRMRADAVTHDLDLSGGIDQVRRGFSRSQVVRNIARAEREGVVVRTAQNADDLSAFYALHTRTRRRQGVPVQPRRFFELLWTELVERGLASILLADAAGRQAIAGALFLIASGTTVYKFGASDTDSWRHRPNHMIFSTAIEQACERGDVRLDFGRTDLANEGLRAFKRSWGGAERPLIYSSLAPGAFAGGEGILTRALGATIRTGPAWVCRGIGETLYRYAASR